MCISFHIVLPFRLSPHTHTLLLQTEFKGEILLILSSTAHHFCEVYSLKENC